MDIKLLKPIPPKELNKVQVVISEELKEFIIELEKLPIGIPKLFDSSARRLMGNYRSHIFHNEGKFPFLGGRRFQGFEVQELEKFLIIRVK